MSDKNKENSDSSTNWKDYELLEETKKLRTAKSTLYVPKKDRYEDASSSAFIFTIFGAIGDAVVILTILGILHLPIANNIISQIAMIGLFSFFLFVGITSWKKARFLKTELEDEENDTNAINTWLEENLTLDVLSALTDPAQAEEINYLHQLDYVKEQLNKQFSNLDEEYVDLLADNYLSKLYDEQ